MRVFILFDSYGQGNSFQQIENDMFFRENFPFSCPLTTFSPDTCDFSRKYHMTLTTEIQPFTEALEIKRCMTLTTQIQSFTTTLRILPTIMFFISIFISLFLLFAIYFYSLLFFGCVNNKSNDYNTKNPAESWWFSWADGLFSSCFLRVFHAPASNSSKNRSRRKVFSQNILKNRWLCYQNRWKHCGLENRKPLLFVMFYFHGRADMAVLVPKISPCAKWREKVYLLFDLLWMVSIDNDSVYITWKFS